MKKEKYVWVTIVPTVAVCVAEFENDVTGITQPAVAFGSEAIVGIEREVERKDFRLGTVRTNDDIEYANGLTLGVDGADFNGFTLKGDVFA